MWNRPIPNPVHRFASGQILCNRTEFDYYGYRQPVVLRGTITRLVDSTFGNLRSKLHHELLDVHGGRLEIAAEEVSASVPMSTHRILYRTCAQFFWRIVFNNQRKPSVEVDTGTEKGCAPNRLPAKLFLVGRNRRSGVDGVANPPNSGVFRRPRRRRPQASRAGVA